ncbi:MAG: DNA polymerase III subunit delta [Prochlorotrichaceae cyanobacterium]
MPVYLYWGEDDFALGQAVQTLKAQTLDPNWSSFNFDRILPEQPNGAIEGLNQAMTQPFGLGQRLVWIVDSPVLQNCPEEVLAEVERTLPQIPDTTVLLWTSVSKPNGRLKLTKLLQKYAEIQEFSVIPPWKTEQIEAQVRHIAQVVGVRLSRPAGNFLVEAIGNNTRQLYGELEKLKLYAEQTSEPLDLAIVERLVTTSTQNSLQLAGSIRIGDTPKALELLQDLINRNEAPLKILATLVGQFRTWLWVKVMLDSGERDDKTIAAQAEISNPKRVYFLQQEIRNLSLKQLLQTLPLLLDAETKLKRGQDALSTLQTSIIQLCEICRS